jgi:protein-L-isoaspartate(D-aspartate) O-methyltransferase
MVDYTEQRKYMIEGNLRPGGIRDPILLRAVQQIPRENFLPEQLKPRAYLDDDIKLDKTHFLLRPQDLLRMIQALRVTPHDKVLDIGCTTGYSSILLSFLAKDVVGLEEESAFVLQARDLANLEGTTNISFVSGAYKQGYSGGAPYNSILLQRAYMEPPQEIQDQLADNGRLVYIKQTSPIYGQACLMEKHHHQTSHRPLFELCVPYFHKNKMGFSF